MQLPQMDAHGRAETGPEVQHRRHKSEKQRENNSGEERDQKYTKEEKKLLNYKGKKKSGKHKK